MPVSLQSLRNTWQGLPRLIRCLWSTSSSCHRSQSLSCGRVTRHFFWEVQTVLHACCPRESRFGGWEAKDRLRDWNSGICRVDGHHHRVTAVRSLIQGHYFQNSVPDPPMYELPLVPALRVLLLWAPLSACREFAAWIQRGVIQDAWRCHTKKTTSCCKCTASTPSLVHRWLHELSL